MNLLVVGLIQRYIIQALEQVLPNIPAYGKPVIAAALSAVAAWLGAVHAPAEVLQSLPGTGVFLSAVLAWVVTDAIHGILNFVEKAAKKA